MNTELISLPFQGDNLSYAVKNGEQMVPVRPICENLGLDWKSQHRKLMSEKERWSVVIMTTVGTDLKVREMVCLPCRRLFGWLATIHPNRVKEKVREKLIAYQQHCDDILYRHFMGHHAHVPMHEIPTDEYIDLLKSRNRLALLEQRQRRRLSEAEQAEILSLRGVGRNNGEIGRAIQRSASTVASFLRRAGDTKNV